MCMYKLWVFTLNKYIHNQNILYYVSDGNLPSDSLPGTDCLLGFVCSK